MVAICQKRTNNDLSFWSALGWCFSHRREAINLTLPLFSFGFPTNNSEVILGLVSRHSESFQEAYLHA